MLGYFEEIFHAFLPPPLQTQESASAVYLKPTRVTESFRLRTVHFPWGHGEFVSVVRLKIENSELLPYFQLA